LQHWYTQLVGCRTVPVVRDDGCGLDQPPLMPVR